MKMKMKMKKKMKMKIKMKKQKKQKRQRKLATARSVSANSAAVKRWSARQTLSASKKWIPMRCAWSRWRRLVPLLSMLICVT